MTLIGLIYTDFFGLFNYVETDALFFYLTFDMSNLFAASFDLS
jgi:hypothetical protein